MPPPTASLLRRLFSCFSSSSTTTTTITNNHNNHNNHPLPPQSPPPTAIPPRRHSSAATKPRPHLSDLFLNSPIPPRHSAFSSIPSSAPTIRRRSGTRSLVTATFLGPPRRHVWFCLQANPTTPKPSLLLEFSITTSWLARKMNSGFLRITLECNGAEFGGCGLHSVPVWNLFLDGRRVGYAARRKAVDQEMRVVVKRVMGMEIGAGVVGDQNEDQVVMYMRGEYEWVVGGVDSESFHLVSGGGDEEEQQQQLSVFLLRRRG